MSINHVEIKDFLVFKGKFAVDFCAGVNVFIGANGTGKTTLIKYLYWWIANYKYRNEKFDVDGRSRFAEPEYYFGGMDTPKTIRALPDVTADKETREQVFIPEKEMLSNSKGLLALYNNSNIPFQKQYIDILIKAELPEKREISPCCQKLIDKVGNVIDGEVIYEQDVFYIKKKKTNKKLPFSWEASGYRKFGLLWKLLRNGLLESDSILFWDEPENSLNPELVPILVDILLELSRNGVQIFIATHCEILANYFNVLRKNGDKVMFYSLFKEGEQIKVNFNDRFDLLTPNRLSTEPVRLYEKELDKIFDND
ncbi:MAG: AAA family ATPase [Planctomycetaceae bacterium]|jgi:predicted ATP-dependent endonuclease of OLD family|nr:AAA family ATPase [Planctomycetaceae bacterium]